MICRLVRWLCRLVPVPAWQKLLVRFHLGRCPACANEFAVEKKLIDVIGCSHQSAEPVDLWPAVSRGIETGQAMTGSPDPSHSRLLVRWGWLFAASLLISAVVLVTTRHVPRQLSRPNGAEPEPLPRAIMRSATIGSRPATVYYFQSQNPDRLIVWVQKT